MALQSLRVSYVALPLSTIMEVRPEQPENAPAPIEVTLLGMEMEDNPEQPEKAP